MTLFRSHSVGSTHLINYVLKCHEVAQSLSLQLILTVHQTSSSLGTQISYTTAPRIGSNFLCCGICNVDQLDAYDVIKSTDSLLTYIAVDIEKRGIFRYDGTAGNSYSGNMEKIILGIISDESKLIGIRMNFLTANSVVDHIIRLHPVLYRRKIALVGLGDIGFRIGLQLVSCGSDLNIYSRDVESLREKASLIDAIKHPNTLARPLCHSTLESCIANKDIIVLATNSVNVLTEFHASLVKEDTQIISVGHSELSFCFLESLTNLKCNVLRFDITHSLVSYITDYLSSPIRLGKSKSVNGHRLISNGFPGRPGDLVVDDVDNPFLVYGAFDSNGVFIRAFSLYGASNSQAHG